MKKELLTLCVALVALGGCQQSDGLDDSMELAGTDTFSSHELALFGEKGGLPWGSAASTTLKANTPTAGQTFGKALAVADITGTGKLDVVTAQGASFLEHGKVLIHSPGNADLIAVDFTKADESNIDSYGMALAAGNLCPELGAQVIIASAPTYNGYRGGFGIIYKKDKKYQTNVRLYQPEIKEGFALAGTQLTVGDIDGDGKNDLVFQSQPIDADYNYLVPNVSVILDVCALQSGDYKVAASVEGSTNNSAFGSELHIVDLDGKGQKEIVIVDNLYREPGNDVAANGAIFFYKWEDGKLVESRQPIIGEHTRSYGAAIESVAFSDIDSDGDLDLIVGEPMVQITGKREGRVRTYTNNGAANAFDKSDVRWMAVGGRSHGRFGSNVHVADVNYDGVNDLIVSAPGLRGSNKEDRAQGYVYVYMGTKDGSIFSKDPFWSYLSDVSTNLNDDFGRNVAVADLDSKGWADLIVAAPNASSNASSLDEGRVDIFMQSEGHCYTASGCFVQTDGKCYMASGVSDNNKCLVCDPSKNNFGLVELVCKDVSGECRESMTCNPAKGCQANNKPNGTACGQTQCISGNYYSHYACVNGECLEDMDYCGNYSCNAENNGCLTSCKDNSDCAEGNKCISNQCVEDKNLPPSVIIPEKYAVIQGESITISASAKDPDGDKLIYQWDADPAFLDNFKFIDNRGIYTVPAGTPSGTSYKVTVTVTDEGGNSASSSTTVTVTSAKIEIASPEEGSVTTNTNITISGYTNTSGHISVRHAESKLDICKAAISKAGWECQTELAPGDYAIEAIQTKDDTIVSKVRLFTIASAEEPNQAPVIVLDAKELDIVTGSERIIDASASHDPDGDALTYSWKCSGSLTIQEDEKPGVALVKANDAPIGSTEVCTVTVTDAKKATTTANITVNITAPDYHITMVSPANGDIFMTDGVAAKVTFKGKTNYLQEDERILICDVDGNPCLSGAVTLSPEGDWETSMHIMAGEYTFYATYESWKDWIRSEPVSITIRNPDGDDYFITLTSPKLGDIVQNPVTFEGAVSESIGPDNGTVVVHDVEMDKELCRTAAQGKGAWNCLTTALPAGQYNVEARLYNTIGFLLGVSKNVNFVLSEAVSVPVITSPKSGDTVSLRPTVSGELDSSVDGKVHVWYTQEGEKDTLLCTANIKSDKTWACTAGYDLEPGTTYAFQANTENSAGKFSQMSNAVVVTTQAKEVSEIVILSPAEGAKLPDSYAIIISGSASVGSKVDVYAKQKSGEDDLLCSATTTQDGLWACNDLKLSVGAYTIYADDATKPGIVASNSVNFSVTKESPSPDVDYNNARGGSCSMTTTHTSNFGWLLMIAGFAGFGLIRRRRTC